MTGLRLSRRHFLALAPLMLTACQSLDAGGSETPDLPPEISTAAAASIAGDLVTRLAEHADPGKTTILLAPDGSAFALALEASLKTWGYTIVSEPGKGDKPKPVRLTHSIEPFEGQVLVRLSTDTLDLGRAYAVKADAASPTSPLSVARRA